MTFGLLRSILFSSNETVLFVDVVITLYVENDKDDVVVRDVDNDEELKNDYGEMRFQRRIMGNWYAITGFELAFYDLFLVSERQG
ncbi:hypothetical protein RYX36_022407 [Vicia faba]